MFGRIKQIAWGALFGCLIATQALGQATLLPNAKQQFFTPQGIPAAAGTVDFYVPSTTTRKTTWKSSTETTGNQNTNPVLLDGGGFAQIYGDGQYRQVVKDADGNTIWDAITASTGSGGGGGGTTVGDGNIVGTILPWAGLVAPPNYLFAYGQAINRADYPLFFSTVTLATAVICTSGLNVLSAISDTQSIRIGAPVEVSCVPPGNTVTAVSSNTVTLTANATVSTAVNATFFPFGNGNGSTTFNVPDLRGRGLTGRNNMGGVAATGILSTQYYGSSPNAIGALGGAESTGLTISNLQTFTPGGTIANGAITNVVTGGTNGAVNSTTAVSAGGHAFADVGSAIVVTSSQATSTFTGSPVGSNTPFTRIQPSFTTNYIVKVLPDASTVVATGVASLGGMTGVVLCGSGITCGGNTISATAATLPMVVGTTGIVGGLNPGYFYNNGGVLGTGIETNVTSYGAVANDVTKATVNQTAFNAAFAASKVVTCSPSTAMYYVQKITVPTDATLLSGCKLIAAGTYAGSDGVVSVVNNTAGFTFDQGSISVSGVTYPTTAAILVTGSTNATISNSAFPAASKTVVAASNTNFRMLYNTITGYVFNVLYDTGGSSGIHVTGNKASGGTDVGGTGFNGIAFLINNANDVVITDNIVIGVKIWAYSTQNTDNVNISNNIALGGVRECITAWGQFGVISGNVCSFDSASTDYCMSFIVNYFEVSNNNCVAPRYTAFFFTSNSFSGTYGIGGSLIGNTVSTPATTNNAGTGWTFLYLEQNVTGMTISNNTVIDEYGTLSHYYWRVSGTPTGNQFYTLQGAIPLIDVFGNGLDQGNGIFRTKNIQTDMLLFNVGAFSPIQALSNNTGFQNAFAVQNSGTISNAGTTASLSAGLTAVPNGYIQLITTGGATPLARLESGTDMTGGLNIRALAGNLTLTAPTVTGSFTATGLVTNADLTNPATTVNGQTCTLGSTCTITATASSTLTFGTHLTSGGASYNGSSPVTITSDATSANTVSTIMARDGSGQVAATTFTGALTGHASLDLALTGGTMSGAIAMGGSNITGVGNLAATTINGNTFSTGTGVLTIAASKTLTASNTLTFTGTDGSSVAFGTGGTVLYGNQTIMLSGDVGGSGTTAITTVLGNIPTGVTAAGTILHSNIAAPSTPASGKDIVWTDSTDLRFHDKNASGVIGTTVVADTGAANNYISAISVAGAISKSRPACGTLSDSSTGCSTTVGTIATQAASAVAITGGTIAGLTGLAIRDTSAAFDVTFAAVSSTPLTAGRTLTFDMGNVAHTLKLGTTANTITFPNVTSDTVGMLGTAQTWTGLNTFSAGASNVVTLKSTATNTQMYIDTAGASQQAGVAFYDNGTQQWLFQKQGNGNFLIFDAVNGQSSFTITQGAAAAGFLTIGYTTDATSTSTGAIRNPGGMSVNKRVWMNGLSTAGAGLSAACVENTGEITQNTGVTTCLISAREWKKNIRPLPDLTANLAALQPRLFDWRDPRNGTDEQIGFIADEVAAVDNRLAVKGKNGKWASWRQEEMIALLVQGYQFVKAANDNLETRLAKLESRK